jgi:hypothetical protein
MNQLSGRQRVGYILGIVVGFVNLPGAFVPGGEDSSGAPTGPPVEILVVAAVLGLLIMGLLVGAMRTGRHGFTRAAAVFLVLGALLALPGVLTTSVDAWIRVFAGLYVLATLTSLVLMFSPARRAVPALD